MLDIKKKQYTALSKFEKHLNRGYYGDYVYGLIEPDFNTLYAIYRECGGQERLRYSCNTCILRLTKTLGEAYFKYKENLK